MKQLTCEMCGSTDLIKQNGIFVCQTCGCKYSVEDAKKLMMEVTGEVVVKNMAQLSNLLKLAHSSFESQNFHRAEEFCNQVIQLDDANYEAWKLKGEAINYQTTVSNPRILEAYNCIMTAYRIASDAEKDVKKDEILESLKTCFEGEISFWLEQIISGRPTKDNLKRAEDAYVDSWNKMRFAFRELDLDGDEYLFEFTAYYLTSAVAKAKKAWKTTVAYNYYRDSYQDGKWTDDKYRPTEDIFMTFVDEADNLINFMLECSKHTNKKTDLNTKVGIYNNVICFHKALLEAQSFIIRGSNVTYGYTWDVTKSLSAEAKQGRKEIIAQCEKKIQAIIKDEGTMKSDAGTLLACAITQLRDRNHAGAKCAFEVFISRVPNEPVGYIGRTLTVLDDTDMSVEDFRQSILATKDLVAGSEWNIFKERLKQIIDFRVCEGGSTLLMLACEHRLFDVFEILISQGANIHARSPYNTTALFHLCYKQSSPEQLEDAKKIARKLLDMGAEVDVKNKGGVSLYNSNTDYAIVQMLRDKYPELEQGAKVGGCYVATAVYGSYNCPQVWTLRRYRDYTLVETWYGRAFIRTYYAISPTLVKWFGHTEWFKKMWKGTLDRMVDKFQEQGIESTPYEDREW